MATLVNGEPKASKSREAKAMTESMGKLKGYYTDFAGFLGDVRSEMRKVVTPSRKEVQATTTVVILAVFLFGVYFMVVDFVCQNGLHALLGKVGGF